MLRYLLASSQSPPGSPIINGSNHVSLGNEVTLNCSSTGGSPSPTVTWFVNDKKITNGVSTLNNGSTLTASLTFTASLNVHLSVFECQANNSELQNPIGITTLLFVYRKWKYYNYRHINELCVKWSVKITK